MNDFSEIFSTLSHEFKTPLSYISMFAELIQKMCENEVFNIKDLTEHANKIRYYCNKLDNLTDTILTAADTGNQSVPLNRNGDIAEFFDLLVQNSTNIASGLNLKIKVNNKLSDTQFCCDYGYLEQIALNLISNANKYNDKEKKLITITLSDNESSLVIKFKDNGMGMEKDHADKIFDKLYRIRTPERAGINGTGLGLYIVKKLVTSMNGEITLKSNPGKGTEFTITLPKNAEPAIVFTELHTDCFTQKTIFACLTDSIDYVDLPKA